MKREERERSEGEILIFPYYALVSDHHLAILANNEIRWTIIVTINFGYLLLVLTSRMTFKSTYFVVLTGIEKPMPVPLGEEKNFLFLIYKKDCPPSSFF